MRTPARLYETATPTGQSLKPLWHVGEKRMLFAGCLQRNELHSHSAPVLLAGLYDDFQLRIGFGSWFRCRAAVIRAGTAYEFDAGGQPFSVIYVEPNETSADGLAPLVADTREEGGALIGSRCELSLVQSLYEDPASPRWVEDAMDDLMGFAKLRNGKDIDRRVRRAIDCLQNDPEDSEGVPLRPLALVARAAGLSTSRFQHLFKEQVGVSYRRYAAWARMRVAVSEVVKGSNFTTAAHASGFYDQPHFAREFRRIFGAPAGRSLAGVRH